jgi:hypothetical protein
MTVEMSPQAKRLSKANDRDPYCCTFDYPGLVAPCFKNRERARNSIKNSSVCASSNRISGDKAGPTRWLDQRDARRRAEGRPPRWGIDYL